MNILYFKRKIPSNIFTDYKHVSCWFSVGIWITSLVANRWPLLIPLYVCCLAVAWWEAEYKCFSVSSSNQWVWALFSKYPLGVRRFSCCWYIFYLIQLVVLSILQETWYNRKIKETSVSDTSICGWELSFPFWGPSHDIEARQKIQCFSRGNV